MSWHEVAEKEGRIYCQKEKTWCAFVNMNTGLCTRKECVNKKDGDKKYGGS